MGTALRVEDLSLVGKLTGRRSAQAMLTVNGSLRSLGGSGRASRQRGEEELVKSAEAVGQTVGCCW